MQQFRFRLERVFEWQQRLCSLQEEKLRLSLVEVAATQTQLARLKAQALATEQEFRKHASFTATDLKALAACRSDSARKENLLVSELRTRERRANEERGKLTARRRRMKMLERLRNRSLQQFQATVDKERDALALECYSSNLISQGAYGRSQAVVVKPGASTS